MFASVFEALSRCWVLHVDISSAFLTSGIVFSGVLLVSSEAGAAELATAVAALVRHCRTLSPALGRSFVSVVYCVSLGTLGNWWSLGGMLIGVLSFGKLNVLSRAIWGNLLPGRKVTLLFDLLERSFVEIQSYVILPGRSSLVVHVGIDLTSGCRLVCLVLRTCTRGHWNWISLAAHGFQIGVGLSRCWLWRTADLVNQALERL